MIINSNYIIRAVVSGEEYFFEYDTPDMWSALEKFWHEDYPEVLVKKKDSGIFPIDVYSMENGQVLDCYQLAFIAACFHAFYDNGFKHCGPYTIDEFDKNLYEKRMQMDKEKKQQDYEQARID